MYSISTFVKSSFALFFLIFKQEGKMNKVETMLHAFVCGFPGDSDGKESACDAGDLGSIPELGRTPGEGNGYPLQYS